MIINALMLSTYHPTMPSSPTFFDFTITIFCFFSALIACDMFKKKFNLSQGLAESIGCTLGFANIYIASRFFHIQVYLLFGTGLPWEKSGRILLFLVPCLCVTLYLIYKKFMNNNR